MDMQELFGYSGKKVLVSGAFSGMGRAAARLLSQLGAEVYVVCRRNGRHNACIYRAELATCTGKTRHLAGEFLPPRRRGLPVQKRDHIL